MEENRAMKPEGEIGATGTRLPASAFRLRGWALRFRPPERAGNGPVGLSPEEVRPHQLRATSFGTRNQEHLRLPQRCAQSRRAPMVERSDRGGAGSSSSDLAT